MKTPVIEKAKYLRILAYGKPGSGKTTFCGSFGLDDRTAPVLHIDLGGNFEVLHKLPYTGVTQKLGTPAYKVLQPESLEELNPIYDWLAQGQPKIESKLGLISGYKTVVFDGFTDVQRQAFDTAMATTEIKFGSRYPKRSYNHYGAVLQQMTHMATKLRELNIHVVVTALEHTKNVYPIAGDESSSYQYVAPMLDGESKHEVPGYMLTVLRITASASTDKALVKRLGAKFSVASMLHTQYQYGKDQYGFSSTEYGDPTISKMLGGD